MAGIERDSIGTDALCTSGALVGSFIGVLGCAGLNITSLPAVATVAMCGAVGCLLMNADHEGYALTPTLVGTISTAVGFVIGGTIGSLPGDLVGFCGMVGGAMAGGILARYIARQVINNR